MHHITILSFFLANFIRLSSPVFLLILPPRLLFLEHLISPYSRTNHATTPGIDLSRMVSSRSLPSIYMLVVLGAHVGGVFPRLVWFLFHEDAPEIRSMVFLKRRFRDVEFAIVFVFRFKRDRGVNIVERGFPFR